MVDDGRVLTVSCGCPGAGTGACMPACRAGGRTRVIMTAETRIERLWSQADAGKAIPHADRSQLA